MRAMVLVAVVASVARADSSLPAGLPTPECIAPPHDGGPDEALFRRGYERMIARDYPGARAPLFAIVKQYPTSPRIADVYMLFAGYHFVRGDYALSKQLYDKVADELPRSRCAFYALFSVGAQLHLERDDRGALEYYLRAEAAPHDEAADRGLRGAVVASCAAIGDRQRAAALFRARFPAHADEMLDELKRIPR